ncbi:MAG TPA: hypothetical protein VLE43_12885 [Candidatus Saccharimonadia bacterium]|nr:hypothetical protein [Candidatus Saccharimonadia bacterium]
MLTKLHQWFLWCPHKFHWFLVFITGALVPFLTRNNPDEKQHGEWYPFSNYPMYSSFEDTAYYVYVTDLDDKPVALMPTFNSWGSQLKKTYDKLLKQEIDRLKNAAKARGEKYKPRIFQMTGDECRPAGDALLRQICKEARKQDAVRKHPGFRLYHVDIILEDGKIVERTKRVGEVKS